MRLLQIIVASVRAVVKFFVPYAVMRSVLRFKYEVVVDVLDPGTLEGSVRDRWIRQGVLPFGILQLYWYFVRGVRFPGRGRRQVDVCLITDRKYFLPTLVTIASIKGHRNPDLCYVIHVLGKDLGEAERMRLNALAEPYFWMNVHLGHCLPVEAEEINVERHVTTTALLKFYLPGLFPFLDRLLYLDSDILVQGDVAELYDQDLEDAYACVVKDTMTKLGREGHLKWLDFTHSAYFNSGVMLLNLKRLRREAITEKLLEYRLTRRNKFMDQDALNMVLGAHVKFLPLRFNMLTCYFDELSVEEISAFYGERLEDTAEANFRQATILHLGGIVKPWEHRLPVLTDLYAAQAGQVGWDVSI